MPAGLVWWKTSPTSYQVRFRGRKVTDIYYLDAKLTQNNWPDLPWTFSRSGWRRITASIPFKLKPKKANAHIIEVAYKAGVVDPVEETVMIGLRDLVSKA